MRDPHWVELDTQWVLYSCIILYRGYVVTHHIVISTNLFKGTWLMVQHIIISSMMIVSLFHHIFIWTSLFRGTWVMVQLIINDDCIIISSYLHINWPFQRHLANVSSVPSIRHPAGHHVVSCKKRKSQKESENNSEKSQEASLIVVTLNHFHQTWF